MRYRALDILDAFWHLFCCFWHFLLLIVPSLTSCVGGQSLNAMWVLTDHDVNAAGLSRFLVCLCLPYVWCFCRIPLCLWHPWNLNLFVCQCRSSFPVSPPSHRLKFGCARSRVPQICSFCQAASSFCNHLLLIRSLLVNSEMMDCVYSLLILKDIPYAVLVRCFHHLLLMSFRVVRLAPRSHIVSDRHKGRLEPHCWRPEISCGRYSYQQLVCPSEAAFLAADVVDGYWY